MDPVTIAIIAGIATGVATGVSTSATDTSTKLIVDAYGNFKAIIQKKFGSVAKAAEKLESNPDSEGDKLVLQEEIRKVKADQDQELLIAAKKLMDLINAKQATSAGENVFNISGGTVQGVVQDNKGDVTMNFGDTPPKD
jgi:hypothetical protein